MWNRVMLAVGLLLLAAAPLRAAEVKPETKPETTEAATAMERARRQAANPMRVILEASKVRRKLGGEADGAAPAVTTPAVTAAANANASAAAAAANAAAAAAAASAATPASATAAAPAPARLAIVTATLDATLVAPAAPVAALQVAEPVAALIVPASPNGPTPAPTAVFAQPKLLEMVEPVIPGKVLDDLRKPLEVLADLTIRADGSVADVKLLPPVPRQTQR